MTQRQSNPSLSKKTQQPSSDTPLPPSLRNLSDAEVKLAQPLLAMLKDPSKGRDNALELLRQPEELKVLAVDIFLLRALLQDDSKVPGAQSSSTGSRPNAPKLTDEQKEKITARLLRLRESVDLPQEKRINKTWNEFLKRIPELSIFQVRALDAHITMRSKSTLS